MSILLLFNFDLKSIHNPNHYAFLGNTIDEVHDFDGSPINEDYCVFGMKKCRLRQYLITLPEILRKTMSSKIYYKIFMKNNINETLGCQVSSQMEEPSCLKSKCCISTEEAIKSLKSSSVVKKKENGPSESIN